MCAEPSRVPSVGSYRRNVGWNLGSALLSHAIEPIFLILLARLLDPAAFGVYAIVVAVRALFSVVKDLGLSAAIVVDQTRNDHRDIQAGVQLATAMFASIVLVAGTGQLQVWLEQPELSALLPWLCVSFFLSALEDPLVTHLRKQNAYRLLFWRRAIPAMASGVTAVALAASGFGVMALILGHIAGQILNIAYLAFTAGGWLKPTLEYSRVKQLWQLGGHVTAQSFAGYLVMQADALIVGRALGAAALGLFRMAQQIAVLMPALLLGQVREVLFTDAAAGACRSGHIQRRYDGFLYLLPFSILYALGIYSLAPVAVPWLMGEQWHGLVAPLQLMVLTVVSSHLAAPNNDLGRILGIARHYTVFSVLRSIVTLAAVWLGASISMDALLVVWVGVTLASNYANCLLFQWSQSQVRVPGVLHFVFMGIAGVYVSMVF